MRAALMGLLLLASCASAAEQPAAPTEPPSAEDTCGVSGFRHLVGADAAAIDRAALPPGARVIGPNDIVTMDYRAERLNIRTDAAGKVSDLGCF
jgi:hypothetical protein